MSLWKKFWKEIRTRDTLTTMENAEKEELFLFRVDRFMQGRPCNIYFGYVVDSDELFQELAPLVIDIINELLQNCFVFTHVYPTSHTSHNGEKIIFQDIMQSFAQTYINSTQFNSNQTCKILHDKKSSLITCAKMADINTLHSFYGSIFPKYFDNYIYGFYEKPQNTEKDFAETTVFLSTNMHDILFSYHHFHVGLDIQINSNAICEDEVVEVIKMVCKEHGKTLRVEID